jgi:hypothetical protein
MAIQTALWKVGQQPQELAMGVQTVESNWRT